MSAKPATRVYRGIARDHDGANARICVMDHGNGPTERKRATVLYELSPEEPFWWGYGGGSSSRTASALIEDVLDEVDGAGLSGPLLTDVKVAFTHEFLAYFHDEQEFWLPASAVVRWIHGYLHERANS